MSDEPLNPPSLTKLLTALAVGVRSVNSLPLKQRDEDADDRSFWNSDNEDNNEEEDEDNEFSFQMAFPEFNSLCFETRNYLSTLLTKVLKASMGQLNNNTASAELLLEDIMFDFDDPRLWENAAEICDLLLEKVELYIQNVHEGRAGLDFDDSNEQQQQTQMDNARRIGTMARNKARDKFNLLTSSLVDMEKSQLTFEFAQSVNNSRTDIFQPNLNNACCDLSLQLVPGCGIDVKRYGGSIPEDIIAPSRHYAHPYQDIIETFEYKEEQFEIETSGIYGRSGTLQNESLASAQGIWIDTEDDLQKLVARIENTNNGLAEDSDEFQEIAIDLEAHNYRSFSGFVCTMQLSLRRPTVPDGKKASLDATGTESIETSYDFIIDTLALRNVMNKYMAPVFANPNIVKVMHGADSDVLWLQRDFGIYIVNLFDTGRASRILPHFTSAGLAYLLRKFAKFEADKKHQLSDWRQRPVPIEMLQYAISDTMYLLDVYEKVKEELKEHESDDLSIKHVLDASKKVCLIRYDKEPFVPSSYKRLISSKRGKKKGLLLNDQQESVLKTLYDWRDAIAREEDESLQYVCPNAGLLRISTSCPLSIASLQSCMNPLPPLILKYGDTILRLVKGCLDNTSATNSPFTKKDLVTATMNSKEKLQNKDKSGVIIDDKTSYKQAGWVLRQTLNDQGVMNSNMTENEESTSQIEIHSSNKNYDSKSHTSHSLEMGLVISKNDISNSRGKSVDGQGAARVILDHMQDELLQSGGGVEAQNQFAQKCAGRIRNKMMDGNQNLLGLVKTTKFIQEGQDNRSESSQTNTGEKNEADAEEISIPKSMKDIYRYVHIFLSIVHFQVKNYSLGVLLELAIGTEDVQRRYLFSLTTTILK